MLLGIKSWNYLKNYWRFFKVKKGDMQFEVVVKAIIILLVLFLLIVFAKYLNTIKEAVLGLG